MIAVNDDLFRFLIHRFYQHRDSAFEWVRYVRTSRQRIENGYVYNTISDVRSLRFVNYIFYHLIEMISMYILQCIYLGDVLEFIRRL